MTVIFTLLVLAVILVNGWTDAPNAISTCVSTRSMTPRGALALAAVCNLAGSVIMALLNSRVAQTVFNIARLPSDPHTAIISLCAGLCAVVIWSVFASLLGLPTSESHALLSGISGAAVASSRSLSVINTDEWKSVLFGLLLSTLPTILIARVIYSVMKRFLRLFERRKAIRHFTRAQRWSAATSSFLHGGQDSQKFMGVLMMGLSLSVGGASEEGFRIPLPVIIACALVMTLGTLIGGCRRIKKGGVDMVALDASGGTASDMSSSCILTLCSIHGIPVSTTHTKNCAMMGVGSISRGGTNMRIARQMLLAWVLTFPVCALIGFALVNLIELLL